jgi:flagellar hook-length control protein FliK
LDSGLIGKMTDYASAEGMATGSQKQAGTAPQAANIEVAADTVERSDPATARDAAAARVDTAPGTTPLSASQPNTASNATGSSASAQLQAALGSAQWGREFGNQVVSVTLRGEQQVSLHLNPRELGPLVVEVAMVNNQAQLQFLASQQSVRAAVEQALPELRQIFEEQGLTLGDTNVSDHPQHDSPPREYLVANAETALSSPPRVGDPLPAELPLPASTALERVRGRVDLYI